MTNRHENSPYLPRPAELVSIKPLTSREKLFTVRMKGGGALGHRPGQFVEVSIPGVGEAPISVSSSPTRADDAFELCVRAAGNVTGALHRMGAGAHVGIRGPYGRGFPAGDMAGFNVLFVAGGLGLAPLRSMINYALDRRADYGELSLLYGARTPADMLFTDELDEWRAREDFRVQTTVDAAESGWTGNVGVITRLFGKIKVDPSRTVALVVGPPVMFRYVLKSLLLTGVLESRIFLSLERRMKCGLGKCGHCQIDNLYVCRSGPVFQYTKVRNLKEAL